ncbi:MAG: hypothetical protein H6684_05125 [Deltaproteobacteria bacterium]|nr:hypothetical protein [Deltaproteobacteria bacterium]
MLSPDVQIVDIDGRHWKNLLDLPNGPKRWSTFLLIFMRDDECVKALRVPGGPIPNFEFVGDENLAPLAKKYGVDYVAVAPVALLRRVFSQAQNAVRRADDWDQQIRSMVTTVSALVRSEVRWYPRAPRFVPKVDGEKLGGWIERLWPDGTAIGLFAFDGTRPHTSLIVGKEGGKITRMTTLDYFGMADGPLHWPVAQGEIYMRCRDEFLPLHVAFWFERESLEEMLAGPKGLSYFHLACKRRRASMMPAPFKWRALLWAARVFGGR